MSDSMDEFNQRVSTRLNDTGDDRPIVHLNAAFVQKEQQEDIINNSTQTMSMWAVYNGTNYRPCEYAIPTIPPGQYTVEHTEAHGIFFQKTTTNLDDIVDLPDSKSNKVIQEVSRFWQFENRFRTFGFLWKRGILLWGPPGSGKTICLQQVSKNIVDQGGIAIYAEHPGLTANGLKLLRLVEPKRPIVVILEDLDAMLDRYGETEMLALMDGELQIETVVFIATTNYPEKLDKRFINRPSRFDMIEKIGMPSADARRVFFITKNQKFKDPRKEPELNMWVQETNGFSIAHMKELIISVEIFETPFKDAVKYLKKMMDIHPSSDESSGSFGFCQSGNDR